jgi:hypothetical protein
VLQEVLDLLVLVLLDLQEMMVLPDQLVLLVLPEQELPVQPDQLALLVVMVLLV